MIPPFLIALCANYAGLVCLSLSMDRHHEQVLGNRPAANWAVLLRVGGWSLMLVAAAICVAHWGFSVGFFGVWGGALSLAAFLYVFALPYAPRLAAGLAVSGPALLVLGLLQAAIANSTTG